MLSTRFDRSSKRIYNDPSRHKKMLRRIFYFILVIALTMTVSFWPGFHPETFFIPEYHWQLDMICHSGYYFVGAMAIYILTGRRQKIA
ncbi:MAG TPA: hypothetical protein VM012_08635, partial [Flavitalea sp.]|nr:hypothetical protein [Flavitalea sp.]